MHGLHHFGVSKSLLDWIVGSDDMFEEQCVCLHPLNMPKGKKRGEITQEACLRNRSTLPEEP